MSHGSVRQYLSEEERAIVEDKFAERAKRTMPRRPVDLRPPSPESSYTYDYEDSEEEIPEIEDEEWDHFEQKLPPTRQWKEVSSSSKDRGVTGAVGPASSKEKKKDRGVTGAVGPASPKEKKKEKGMGPNTWVELENRGLLKGKAGPGAFGSGGRDSTAASSKEKSKSRKEFVAAAVEKAVRSGSRASSATAEELKLASNAAHAAAEAAFDAYLAAQAQEKKGAEAGGDSLREQSRDVGVREKASFDRICKATGARPVALASRKSESGGSLVWREAGQTVVLTSRKSVGAETGPALGECPRFVREPEGNAGERGLNALWVVIQILGIVDWHFRIVMEGGEVWLRARRPGHEVAKFYHGTSVTCAQKIFREDAIRPGPRQSASGRKVPVAFMPNDCYNIESYVGPSKVPGHTTLIAQVIGGEAEGKSWQANNPNYRVALSWRPTSAWLRVWNAGSPTDAKRTWSYASAEYVWPHKKGQEPAPSSRALRSPERAEAESREDEPEAARGQRSGRPVDKEFLEALKAVEAGTFEGGKWQAWKEFRERDKLRARGQSATSAASTSTGRKRGSHGDTGKGLAKARLGMHQVRGDQSHCPCAMPGMRSLAAGVSARGDARGVRGVRGLHGQED